MKIGLDLDGVLYNFDKTAQYMMAKHMGYEFREELPWNYAEYWRDVPREEWAWLWRPENVDPLFRHGHLYRGAIEFAYDLALYGPVELVTKRPEAAFRVTWEWLLFHYGEHGKAWPFAGVHILAEGSKSQVPVDVAIDDNPDVLSEWVGTDRGILMVRPWNRLVPFPRRAKTYEEVLREVAASGF